MKAIFVISFILIVSSTSFAQDETTPAQPVVKTLTVEEKLAQTQIKIIKEISQKFKNLLNKKVTPNNQ